MRGNNTTIASMLCAALVLQGCVTARMTTESGTRVTPEVMQAYLNGNTEPFLPYRAVTVDEVTRYADSMRTTHGFPTSDEASRQIAALWATSDASEIPAIRHEMTGRPSAGKFAVVFVNALVSVFTLYTLPIYFSDESSSTLTLVLEDGTEVSQTTRLKWTQIVSSLPKVYKLDHEVTNSAGYEFQVAAMMSHGELLRQRVAREQALLTGLDRNSVEAMTAALRNPDVVLLKQDVMQSLGTTLAKRRDRMDHYEKLVKEFPTFRRHIPGNEQLFFVGPADRPVLAIWRDLRKGADADVLAATIRASGQPYRIFNSDETAWLKKQSIPGPVIAAMIDASAASANAAPAATSAAAGTGGALQKATLQPAAANGTAAAAPENSLAEECVKALAAIKACEQIPGDPFGIARGVCVKQVKKGLGATTCLGI